MRFVLVAILASVVACKTANPNVCCVTDAQCADLGVDEMRPCKAGQACAPDNTCVAAECSDSSECVSPDAPVCVNNLCVASCSVDGECAGSPDGELCADDGTCVGCKSNADCDASAPFCDQEDRQCRGCERDSECPGGVCLEADATCVADAEVLFVSPTGADSGSCSRNAPCKTLTFALTRPGFVIHIDGGSTNIGAMPLAFASSLYIDGTNTVIEGGDATGVFELAQSGAGTRVITLGSITIAAGPGNAFTSTYPAAKIRLHDATIARPIEIANGTFEASRSRFSKGIRCDDGNLTLVENELLDASAYAMGCQSVVLRNRFENRTVGAFTAIGGGATFDNNLVVITDRFIDAVSVVGAATGSAIRFNTVVNLTSIVTSDVAIACDGGLPVTSNVIAYNSTNPIGTTCAARFTLFDTVAPATDTAGEGSKVAEVSTFFADREAKDFHLAPQSPARSSAELGLPVADDLETKPRPNPVGSAPDMGAFEAP